MIKNFQVNSKEINKIKITEICRVKKLFYDGFDESLEFLE